MWDIEEENKNKEGLRDSKHATKKTKEKRIEKDNKEEGEGDVEMG